MAESDFSRPCIIGFGSSPSRCGPVRHAALVRHEISRFPHKERPHMPGSPTTPGRPGARDSAPVRVAFRVGTASAPGIMYLSRLNGWPMRSPVNASPTASRTPRTARGRCGSLLLHRSGLAPPTPCRSPGARRHPTICSRTGVGPRAANRRRAHQQISRWPCPAEYAHPLYGVWCQEVLRLGLCFFLHRLSWGERSFLVRPRRFFVPTAVLLDAARSRGQGWPQATAGGGAQRP